eukprot:UN31125
MSIITFLEFEQLFIMDTISTMEIDKNNELEMEIHFNITMLDLPCEYTQVDVVDTFGTERMDIQGGIKKVRLHHEPESGDRWFKGDDHLKEQINVQGGIAFDEYIETEEMKETFKNFPKAKHAPDLNPQTFEKMLQYFQLTFVNFYAPWCIWSQRMASDWENTAKAVDAKKWPRRDLHVKMIRVNCDEYSDLCSKYHIRGYPTMYMFKDGKMNPEAYREDRTKDEWMKYIDSMVEEYEKVLPNVFHDIGCEISGMVKVSRCPGNFHVQAKSGEHSIAATMTNVSHIVNHLSFGSLLDKKLEERLPLKYQRSLHPL